MIKFLTKAISNALGFSKVEARGTLMLIFVMIAGIGFSRIYIQIIKNPNELESGDADKLEEWVAEVESSFKEKEDQEFDKSVYYPTKKDFNKQSELAKKEKNNAESGFNEESEKEKSEPIIISDLNLASMEDLQQVRGIGPAYSKRIVKFRDLLGGFSSNDQLKEVYGLEAETIEEVQKYFSVQSSPDKLEINSDSAKVLANHPYISYDLAWIIINYRKQNGNINSADDLKKIKAIDEETFVRLKPYLD